MKGDSLPVAGAHDFSSATNDLFGVNQYAAAFLVLSFVSHD